VKNTIHSLYFDKLQIVAYYIIIHKHPCFEQERRHQY